jgi:hypothetical protein
VPVAADGSTPVDSVARSFRLLHRVKRHVLPVGAVETSLRRWRQRGVGPGRQETLLERKLDGLPPAEYEESKTATGNRRGVLPAKKRVGNRDASSDLYTLLRQLSRRPNAARK